MYIEREITPLLQTGSSQVPIVAVIGPRQSGKSTLVKELFKNHLYLDLQDAELFDFANKDAKGFLHSYENEHGIIIDEAQYAPAIFTQLKVEADRNPRPGYYVFSGSQNFLLHEKVSESLAGRVYMYTLLPFSIHELSRAKVLASRIEDQIIKGFYPRVYQPQVNAYDYYDNYIATYVERDIRLIRNIDNILIFKKFMSLCATRIGTTLNYSDLATNCGISVSTAKSWLSLLETSFILFSLPSYHDNLGKRITKSPKLYFYDVGLALALMGLDKETFIKKRDLYGGLFENMIIVDVTKNLHARGIRATLMFYRDSNQNEIDLIIEVKGKIIPVEIKATETMKASFFDTAQWFMEQASGEQPIVVYGGLHPQKRAQGNVVPWNKIENIFSHI